MIKKSIGVVLGLVAMIGLAVSPALADYPPTPGVLVASTSTPAPGESFTLSVPAGSFEGACGNASTVFYPLTSSGEQMGGSIDGPTAPVQDDGSWSAQGVLDTPGRYEAVVTGDGACAGRSFSMIVNVQGAGPGPNPGPVHPQTGADNTMLIAVVGVAFVILGGAAVYAVRRRERI